MKKKTLVFLITCFTALCAYLFIVFYQEAEKTAIRQLNNEQQIHAKQATHGIEDFFATWTGILNSFSKIDAVINADAEGKQYMTLFYESHHEQIRSITRVDEKGRILQTVPHIFAIGSDISGQEHVREILRDHKPVVSNVFKTVQGFDAVALHVPVFRGAVFKGTIAVLIDFENLARRYLEVIKIRKTGYAWVVSSNGTMLYSPVTGLTGKSVFDIFRDFPSIISMTKDMLLGNEGTAAYTFDKIGDQAVTPVKKYAVYMPIQIANSFWSVVVASSEDEILSSLASFRNRLLLVISMILLGGVLFSIISAKAWMIVAEEEKRKRAEEKMLASEELYQTLFEQSPIGLALCTLDGALVDANPAYAVIIGRTVDETLHQTYWDITPQKYAEQEQQQLESLKKTGRYGPYEKEYIHKDGHLVPVKLSGIIVLKDGENHIWSSIEDITERKRIQEKLQTFTEELEKRVKERTMELESRKNELERSQQAIQYLMEDVNETKKDLESANIKLRELDQLKSIFIASMSHELRTPLNSIIGFIGIILQDMAGDISDEQREMLDRSYGAAKHLLALISDVIDISKIEAGKIEAFAEEFMLHDLMEQAFSTLKTDIDAKGLLLETEVPEGIRLNTDRQRLLQCVLNFLSNAVKYSEHGKIRVTAAKEGKTIEIQFADTGIGIKDEDLPKLFGSFVRLDSPLRVTTKGTGPGLYLTKKLTTEVLNGTIDVKSVLGKGSTFILKIPATL